MVEFTASKRMRAKITECAKRAAAIAKGDGFAYKLMDAEMDLNACHSNGCKLDFDKLSGFPDSSFGHDVFGIRRFIDRTTGQLGGGFLPRSAKPKRRRA